MTATAMAPACQGLLRSFFGSGGPAWFALGICAGPVLLLALVLRADRRRGARLTRAGQRRRQRDLFIELLRRAAAAQEPEGKTAS